MATLSQNYAYRFIRAKANIVKMPKKQTDNFRLWRAYVKFMLQRNKTQKEPKTLKYLLQNYSKKEYAEFKKKPMRFV